MTESVAFWLWWYQFSRSSIRLSFWSYSPDAGVDAKELAAVGRSLLFNGDIGENAVAADLSFERSDAVAVCGERKAPISEERLADDPPPRPAAMSRAFSCENGDKFCVVNSEPWDGFVEECSDEAWSNRIEGRVEEILLVSLESTSVDHIIGALLSSKPTLVALLLSKLLHEQAAGVADNPVPGSGLTSRLLWW